MGWTHPPIRPPPHSFAISSIHFLSPANVAWMLLLPYIICINCFSTCNPNSCLFHTYQPWTGCHFQQFMLFFFSETMGSHTPSWPLCISVGLAQVLSRIWLSLLETALRCKESCEPILCVPHCISSIVLLIFLQGGDKGSALSLNKWNV